MWELDYKETWAPKNWCFWTVALEKILESPLDSKEIQSAHPRVNQSWIFIGRTNVEAETSILWAPDVKTDLFEKTLLLEKIEGGRRTGWQRMRWMATPTQWTGVWVISRSWCWTGKSGILQPMGLQRFGHNLVTEFNWTECIRGEISASSLWITKDLLSSTSIMTSELSQPT